MKDTNIFDRGIIQKIEKVSSVERMVLEVESNIKIKLGKGICLYPNKDKIVILQGKSRYVVVVK